jgi:hypothetical protein
MYTLTAIRAEGLHRLLVQFLRAGYVALLLMLSATYAALMSVRRRRAVPALEMYRLAWIMPSQMEAFGMALNPRPRSRAGWAAGGKSDHHNHYCGVACTRGSLPLAARRIIFARFSGWISFLVKLNHGI